MFLERITGDPGLLPPFKPSSSPSSYTSQEEEKTSLFKYLEENSKYYGSGRFILTSSSLSINLMIPPPSSSPHYTQDAIEDQKEINGQKQQQHLHGKKRDRQQDDVTGVETSTKRRRPTTTFVLEEEKTQQRHVELADSKLKEEDAVENRSVKEDIQHQSQLSNHPDFGLSFTKTEPGGLSAVRSAESALDTSRHCEALAVSHDDDDYANKEKSTRPPVLDYVTALHQHKYHDVNLFEMADLLKCIPNVHPVDQRSELEREMGMFCRDWLTRHQDPSFQHLDTYLDSSRDRDMEKIYESEVYIEAQNFVKKFDTKTVAELKNFIDMMPMSKEVFTYEIDWEVVHKYALLEKLRPFISNIARNSIEEERDNIVSDILESMRTHDSASSILKQILTFRLVSEVESERLFRKMWEMLFSETKKLQEGDGKKALGVEVFNDTPKTIDEVLSLEINWVVFDQHDLHEKMKPWIRKEVTELLKKEKTGVVDQVVDVIKNQNSPSQILELLEPSLDGQSEIVVPILWRTLRILVKILETEFPKSLSSANPNSELSNSERKKFMPSDDNLRQQDPLWNGEESSDRARGVIERNRCFSYPSFWRQTKMVDFEKLREAYRVGSAVPMDFEKLSSYDVDWAVSDKEELHNRLRPWIFREVMEFVGKDQEAATRVVDSIVLGIKDHANAKDILELVKPRFGDRSASFVLNLWKKLIFGIQLAGTTGLDPLPAIERERLSREGVKISQYGDRFSRNRHFMMVAIDSENLRKLQQINATMPKTKAELFSYEIKWDVYEKHKLQKKMREGIWIETLELIRQKNEATLVDDQIMWSIFDYHVSASRREFTAREEAIRVFEQIMSSLLKRCPCPSQMAESLEPILGSGSEKFVMRMWYALICGIKVAEAGVERKLNWWGSSELLPADDLDL